MKCFNTNLITVSSVMLNPLEDAVEGLLLGTIKTSLQQTIAALILCKEITKSHVSEMIDVHR